MRVPLKEFIPNNKNAMTKKFGYLCGVILFRDNSFSMYKIFSEKVTLFNPWYAHVSVGVRTVSFSEKIAHILNDTLAINTIST